MRVIQELSSHVTLAIITTLGYATLFRFSESWFIFEGVSTWYMPLGWGLGWYLVLPYRYWPTVTLCMPATFGIVFQGWPENFLTQFLISYVKHSLWYMIPIFFTHKLLNLSSSYNYLSSLQGVLRLLILIVVNQLGNIVHLFDWAYVEIDSANHAEITLTHFVGGFTGILIVLPAMLSLKHWRTISSILNRSDLYKVLVLVVASIGVSIVLFSFFPQTTYLLRVLALFPILYGAFRFQWFGAWCITFAVNGLLLAYSSGELANDVIRDTQFYIFMYGVAGVLLGAIFTDQKRLNSELRHALKKSQSLAKKVVNIQEMERKRLSQNLHDDIGQSLVVTQTETQVLLKTHPFLQDNRSVTAIKAATKNIYESTYNMLSWLRPRILDEFGLYGAITGNYFAARLGSVDIKYIPSIPENINALPQDFSVALFRITQEAVTNAIKHSDARWFKVDVRLNNGLLEWILEDDGIGLTSNVNAKRTDGMGLAGITDRVAALEGSVSFSNTPGLKIEIRFENLKE
jgi:two-component system sensor histidine kinase UhpB